eukprot:8427820-Pyramimonas_sp.AAC.1
MHSSLPPCRSGHQSHQRSKHIPSARANRVEVGVSATFRRGYHESQWRNGAALETKVGQYVGWKRNARIIRRIKRLHDVLYVLYDVFYVYITYYT